MTLKSGWKTYVVGALAVVWSGLYGTGFITEETYLAGMGILNGLGWGALRHGVAKSTE